jgi:phosphoribosylaminoimidazolecarboxamide formyltransferase/IMP cyclohydrolase
MNTQIQNAFNCIFSKEGLESKKTTFSKCNFIFYRWNRRFIKNLGIPVVPVEDVTSTSINLGGRVKHYTQSFGGINRQDNESDAT